MADPVPSRCGDPQQPRRCSRALTRACNQSSSVEFQLLNAVTRPRQKQRRVWSLLPRISLNSCAPFRLAISRNFRGNAGSGIFRQPLRTLPRKPAVCGIGCTHLQASAFCAAMSCECTGVSYTRAQPHKARVERAQLGPAYEAVREQGKGWRALKRARVGWSCAVRASEARGGVSDRVFAAPKAVAYLVVWCSP